MESVIKVLSTKRVNCGCDREYYAYNGEPMGIEEELLVEKVDDITGEHWTEIVYWFRCTACGRLARY